MIDKRPVRNDGFWQATARSAAAKFTPHGAVAVSQARVLVGAHRVSIQSMLAAVRARMIDRATFDNEIRLERAALKAELDATSLPARSTNAAIKALFTLVQAASKQRRASRR